MQIFLILKTFAFFKTFFIRIQDTFCHTVTLVNDNIDTY